MVNAALAAGVCPVDTAQILVHIGELSTSVVIMDGGKLREMRAIHLGAMSHDLPAVLLAAGCGTRQARHASGANRAAHPPFPG